MEINSYPNKISIYLSTWIHYYHLADKFEQSNFGSTVSCVMYRTVAPQRQGKDHIGKRHGKRLTSLAGIVPKHNISIHYVVIHIGNLQRVLLNI